MLLFSVFAGNLAVLAPDFHPCVGKDEAVQICRVLAYNGKGYRLTVNHLFIAGPIR